MKKLRLGLFRKFQILDDDGIDYCPLSAKSKGLIALLALSPDFTRNRSWLQDKLWSDRFPEQSNGSLRQALTDIRRSLSENRDLLITKGDLVSLNSEYFQIESELPQTNGMILDTELFPDLEVRDQEFEHWIRDQRGRISPSNLEINQTKKYDGLVNSPVVMFRTVIEKYPECRDLIENIVRETSRSLLEFGDFCIFNDLFAQTSSDQMRSDQGVVVILHPVSQAGYWLINATIANPITGQVNWIRSVRSPKSENYLEISEQISFQLFEGILETFSQKGSEISQGGLSVSLANLGKSLAFRLDQQSLATADGYFQKAHIGDPRSHHVAWRAYIRNLGSFEHHGTDYFDDKICVEELLGEAIEINPADSTTLAISAQLDYLSGAGTDFCLGIARKAIEANPINPLANAVLANLCVATENFSEGAFFADKALSLSKNTNANYFFEFFCCMSATAEGDYQKAIIHGEIASRLKSEFKAPLRYLVALYLQTGQDKEYYNTLRRLKNFEPGFKHSNLLEDWYPANTLRRMRIVDVLDSKRV